MDYNEVSFTEDKYLPVFEGKVKAKFYNSKDIKTSVYNCITTENTVK